MVSGFEIMSGYAEVRLLRLRHDMSAELEHDDNSWLVVVDVTGCGFDDRGRCRVVLIVVV